MSASSVRLALFDLDHTLLPLDSVHAWGTFTVELGWRDAETHSRANDAFYEQYQAGTLDIAEYVRFATSAAREHGQQRAAEAAERESASTDDVEFGGYRQAGVAGPDAIFIEKSLSRWKLRGDGYLKH